MKAYRIDGQIEVKKRKWQKFYKELAANSEAEAKEKLYCDLGSRQGLGRRNIKIRTIKELKIDEVIDHAVKYQAGGK